MKKLVFLLFAGLVSFVNAGNPFNPKGMTPCGCYTQNSYKIINETTCPFVICVDQAISCPALKGGGEESKCTFNYCASKLFAYHNSDSINILIRNPTIQGGCTTCIDTAIFSFIFSGQRWSFASETNTLFQNYLKGTYLGVTTTYNDSKGGTIPLPNCFVLQDKLIVPSCSGGNAVPFKLVLYKSTDGLLHLKGIY